MRTIEAVSYTHLDVYKRQVLNRSIAEKGIYPAVDPLDSTSRILEPRVVGQDHYDTARRVQEILQPVSYTHLDVYKRQLLKVGFRSQPLPPLKLSLIHI